MTVKRGEKILNFFHIINTVMISLTVFTIISMGVLFFLMSKASDPVDVKINIPDPTVKFGEYLEIVYNNNRHLSCPTIINMSIFDKEGTKISLPEISTNAVGPAIKEITRRKIKIEKAMYNQEVVAGPAKYRLSLTWKCPGNYYQVLFPKTKTYDDVPFEILE